MSYKFELLEKVDEGLWNKRVESLSEGTLFQTTYKAEMCQKTLKQKPFFLIAERNGNIVAQALILTGFISPKALLSKSFLNRAMPLASRFFNSYNIYYGPLIFEKDNYEKTLGGILSFLDKSFKEKGYTLGRILPPLHGRDYGCKEFFRSNGFSAKPSGTILIDLKKDIDALWLGVDERTQRYIRKMEKEGMRVFEAKSEKDIKKYHRMRVETAKRNKIRLPLLDNAMVGWRLLDSSDRIKVFLAEHNGKLISGILISAVNGLMFEGGSAVSDYAIDNKIRGSHFLKWHIIKWGHKKGLRMYDLSGINPEPATRTSKEEGIYQFKNKWGGREVRFNNYEKKYARGRLELVKRLKFSLSR